MGDKPQIINGNAILPIDQSLGWGVSPDPQVLEATGPQVLTVLGDPNGVKIAPKGSLALQRDIAALWQNTDGLSAWTLLTGGGGGGSTIQIRVQLADLPAALVYSAPFGVVPANQPIIAALPFVNVAPTGGGVSTVECSIGASAPPGDLLFDKGQLVGFPSPDFWNVVRDGGVEYAPRVDPSMYDVSSIVRGVAFGFASDVPLDTLATFDVTVIVVLGPALVVP